jgi:hypothetical protein
MANHARILRLVVVGTLALVGCESIDQGKLLCEEAMAGVLACCPGLTQSPVVCEYVQTTPVTWLFLNVDCLVGLSCGELTARGVCAWAQAPGASAVCP